MKKTLTAILGTLLAAAAQAQPPQFEGYVVYRNEVTSKIEGISSNAYKDLLFLGDSAKTAIKNGHYRISNPLCETYYDPEKRRAYLLFKGVDTLFYRDYADDSSRVKKVSRLRDTRQIAGYSCNALRLTFDDFEKQYFYAPALYLNPALDSANKIGRHDLFAREAAAVWLSLVEERQSYTLTQTSRRVQPAALPDSLFRLPNLPQRPFSYESISVAPEFTAEGGWMGFLSRHINADLGARYVKVKKGAREGSEQVIVSFIVSDRGRIINPEVVNRKEVHPRLAAEALRVISESPLWKPATALGAKIPYRINQPITFAVAIQ